jgi:hypothetical protein
MRVLRILTQSGHTANRANHSTSSSASKRKLLENLARVAEIDHFVMAITPGVELAQGQTTTQWMEAWPPGQFLGPAPLPMSRRRTAPAMRAGAGNSAPIRKG